MPVVGLIGVLVAGSVLRDGDRDPASHLAAPDPREPRCFPRRGAGVERPHPPRRADITPGGPLHADRKPALPLRWSSGSCGPTRSWTPTLAARARALLQAPELENLLRLGPPEARRDYLAAHALVRTMLAERVDLLAPTTVRLRSTPLGKPVVVAPPDARRLRFSLSHADGIAMCAIAEDWEIGVDVESARHLGRDPLGGPR